MAQSDPVATVPRPPAIPPKHFALEYLGFRNTPDRREYRLSARIGTDAREYTVWIAHSAFSSAHALLQDGPDICYQKVWHLLSEAGLMDQTSVEVTEGELKDYHAARIPASRRPQAPKPADPAPNPWLQGSRPPPRDRG